MKAGPLHFNRADVDNLVNNVTGTVQRNLGRIVSGPIQTVRTLTQIVGAALLILLPTFFMPRDGDHGRLCRRTAAAASRTGADEVPRVVARPGAEEGPRSDVQ